MRSQHRHPVCLALLAALVGAACGSVPVPSGEPPVSTPDDGDAGAARVGPGVPAVPGSGAPDGAGASGGAPGGGGAGAPGSGGAAGTGGAGAPGDGGDRAADSGDARAPGGSPTCGNGVVEQGERCDPPGSCPTACPSHGCTLSRLEGSAAACTAVCVESGMQTACISDDGCCPRGCNSTNDNDCHAVCGNGVKETGETCDPASSCPRVCPSLGCQLRQLVNAGTCQAACQNAGMQRTCAGGDGCCPPTCNNTNDSDCAPRCDNGVVETGETCEPVAECQRQQAACQSDQNTIRTGSGDASRCTFHCASSPRPCGPGDGVCPAGCGADPDCLPRPSSCTHIQWCHKPDQPNQNMLICITNDDPRCTDGERVAECAREATSVCGADHARPIVYNPPIAGHGTD